MMKQIHRKHLLTTLFLRHNNTKETQTRNNNKTKINKEKEIQKCVQKRTLQMNGEQLIKQPSIFASCESHREFIKKKYIYI